MAQAVEHLPSKHKALSSNPSYAKTKLKALQASKYIKIGMHVRQPSRV
jgi:hypothetical protein